MKNKKVIYGIIALMLLFSFMVYGCGKMITTEECAQIFWDISVNQDVSNASKIGIKEDEAKNIIDADIKQAKNTLSQNFKTQQIKYTNLELDELCNSLLDAYQKMNVKFKEVSNDGKKAEVKVITTYFDIEKLDEKAADDAIDVLKTSNITDQTEYIDKASEMYIKNLISNIKNITPGSDTKEKTFKFIKANNVWVPEDKNSFSSSLNELITNQI